MFVENKEMYHFNNLSDRKNIWIVGNEIDNTENYISDFWTRNVNNDARVIVKTGERQPFFSIIDSYLENEQDKETYVRMLKEASKFLRNYSSAQREMVLEDVRKRYYPEFPSRKNAIYLCDYSQIEYWKQMLDIGDSIELFKVTVTGELFKSSDLLLPDCAESINRMYMQAKKYWEADLTDIDDKKSEYLFSGKVKVLEKI